MFGSRTYLILDGMIQPMNLDEFCRGSSIIDVLQYASAFMWDGVVNDLLYVRILHQNSGTRY